MDSPTSPSSDTISSRLGQSMMLVREKCLSFLPKSTLEVFSILLTFRGVLVYFDINYVLDVPTAPFAVRISNFVQLEDGSVSADVSWNQTGNDVMSFLVSYTYSGQSVSPHHFFFPICIIFDYSLQTWSNVKTSTTVVSILEIPVGVTLTVKVLALNPRGNSDFSSNATATTAGM